MNNFLFTIFIVFILFVAYFCGLQTSKSNDNFSISNAEENFASANGIDTRNFQNLLYTGYIAEAKLYVAQATMNAGETDVEMQIQTAVELIKKAHALKIKMDDEKE